MMRLLSTSRLAVVAATLLVSVTFGGDDPGRWTRVRGGSWEPDAATLAALRAGLQKHVTAEAARTGKSIRPWDEYRFQYQGSTEDRKRVILVNAFCTATGDRRLEDAFVVVLDGGPCFFQVVYEPEENRFRNVAFNGVG